MDRITKEHRSWNMSRIRGKDTAPEMLVRKYLYAHGIRYRLHAKLPGKPDVVIRKNNSVLFINGCFWHGHNNCKYAVTPKSNTDFWQSKISGNVERDQRNRQQLEADGWKVLTVWECELEKDRDRTLQNILSFMKE
ncbi:DNA mismatch endonuclease Vsr [Candidatus Saccharibacteria bacterium]|nr:DNA mismatch endonuclease Vsr [Candidatus Saccharibacteria bacterium]